MTFTRRIRLSLLLVAVLPTLLVMSVIYLYGRSQAQAADSQAASRSVDRFAQYFTGYEAEIKSNVNALAASPYFERAVLLLGAGRFSEVRLEAAPASLDFIEIVDHTHRVVASYHRPGLVGEQLARLERLDGPAIHSVEYDIAGPHASIAAVAPASDRFFIHAGRYLDDTFLKTATQLTGADVRLLVDPADPAPLDGMTVGQLYSERDTLRALLVGGSDAGFYVAASFAGGTETAVMGNLLLISGLVAFASVLLAVILGVYIAARTKREFDNLISAADRVASGDFSTPVMAYDEGEFAQLADSFTEMTFRLREVQKRLATSEKIAAWEAVGRKIAHEIKNPLTPIAISTDDLRRSYQENFDDFPRILNETTTTIKSEVNRLTRMLDEFVRFARMKPPTLSDISPTRLLEPISSLYRTESDSTRLRIENRSDRRTITVDPEGIQQVLVNLIKNSFEATADGSVCVTLTDSPDSLIITVTDRGPGFPQDLLARELEPSVSTKKGGSGLGLVVSQRIVHDHGGTMELHNHADGGAAVTITLPVQHG